MKYKNLNYEILLGSNKDAPVILFLHGWGHNLENLRDIAETLPEYNRYLLDLAGFGKSTIVKENMDLNDYVLEVVDFIKTVIGKNKKIYIVGHSFGGRIGICLSGLYSDLILKTFIVAGAGLIEKKFSIKKTLLFFIRKIFRLLNVFYKMFGKNIYLSKLYKLYFNKFASSDYKNATLEMKEILKKVINQDLQNIAKKIQIPVVLIYGENDVITPISFGRRFHKLIKNSKLYILSTFDHNSILIDGKYQVSTIINNNIKE